MMSQSDVDTSSVPFAVTDRAFIPRERYIDREFFDLENERLWPHVWQMACRLEEIPNVGDYVEYSVGLHSILVVRTSPTEIRAYENACRHRATQLALGCGRFVGGRIVCPFHGWSWNLDGTPTRPLYGESGFDPRTLDPEDLNLVACQVDTWANCVFVNMDLDAPPLAQALEPIPSMVDPLNVDQMYVDWWKGARMHCNWKVALEAFIEGWHVAQTHPQLTMGIGQEYPTDRIAYFSDPNGHAHFVQAQGGKGQTSTGLTAGLSEAEAGIAFARIMCEGGTMVLPKDVHVLEGLRTVEHQPGEFSQKMMQALIAWNKGAGIPFPTPGPDAVAGWGADFFIFPNLFILPLYGNALMYRVRPDTGHPEHCLFEMWSITLYPEGYVPPRPARDDHPADDPAWPVIPRQDFSNIERQQRGLHTARFRGMRLARQYEDGIANLHAHLDTYLAGHSEIGTS